MTTWWLSFFDASRPQGSQFLGACLVTGDKMTDAVLASTQHGCNPGGDVQGIHVPSVLIPFIADKWRHRLLTREECIAFDNELKLNGLRQPDVPDELPKTPPMNLYRHFKGGVYRLIGFGLHSETGDRLVIYQSVETQNIWVRPSHLWDDQVIWPDGQQRSRFVPEGSVETPGALDA